MIDKQLFNIEEIPSLGIPEFIVENVDIQYLNSGIKKKFTSLSKSPVTYTNIYDPTLFKWDFGDGTPIVETDQRVIHHTYARPGTYLVKHQACNFCTCSDWNLCFQSIDVVHKPSIVPLLAYGGLIGLVILKKECEEHKNKKECCKHKECQWLKDENKCAPKCEEGYKLEKIRIDRIKEIDKFVCIPIKERQKSTK